MIKCVSLSALLSLGLAVAPAVADTFFANKTITMMNAGSPGGGYDLYARTVTRHMQRHIPGEPNIVNTNVPGAGSLTLTNQLYSRSPRDGLTMGMPFPGAILGPLLDEDSKANFKPVEFGYIGSASSATRVCAIFHTANVRSFAEARTRETIIGADAPGGSLFDYTAMLRNELGARFNMVRGYKSSVDITLAMERGEVNGICGIDWSSLRAQKQNWIREKRVNIILQMGHDADPELVSMGVPTIWSFVSDPDTREMLNLILSQQTFGRPFVVPPGVPQERLQTLRDAFDATMKDEALLVDANKLGIDISPASGKRLQELIVKLFATDDRVVKRARAAVRP
jgi:tripartite-type tricarboxylate transporter receptor subunit TctC